MTILRRTTTQHSETFTFWVQLSAVAGWDVRRTREPGGEVVGHFEDWHRLERTLARLGQPLWGIEVLPPGA